MKRAIALGLAVAVAVAGVAAARALVRHRFEAPVQGGVNDAGIEFNAFFKKGVPQYVTDLTWQNLSCPAGGFIPFTGTQHWKAGVNRHGKFSKAHAVKNGNGSTVTFTGKFTKKKGKVHVAGTFQLKNVPGCTSGTDKLQYATGGGGRTG
jgi:hypothetical protein